MIDKLYFTEVLNLKKCCNIFSIFIILFFLVVPIAGCSNSNNYNDITTISTYTKKQYDSSKLTLNAIITNDSLDNYEDDEIVSELFSNTDFSYKSVMHDEETVIIQKNVIFQSVTGYVATKKDNLDTISKDGFRYPVMNVNESLGYDGNFIMVEKCLGIFDGWYLYRFTSGF